MSAAQVMEQVNKLPFEEQREVFEHLREKFDDELTPEQIAELERRAEDALKNPGRGKPVEQVFAEIEERLVAKK
jgi:putative addiction module component (TIGR02574 family)